MFCSISQLSFQYLWPPDSRCEPCTFCEEGERDHPHLREAGSIFLSLFELSVAAEKADSGLLPLSWRSLVSMLTIMSDSSAPITISVPKQLNACNCMSVTVHSFIMNFEFFVDIWHYFCQYIMCMCSLNPLTCTGGCLSETSVLSSQWIVMHINDLFTADY